MGDARRRQALGLAPRGLKPEPPPVVQRHVLAMLDRRTVVDANGQFHFSDHSAKPNTYASADLRTLYQWDGKMLRRLDRATMQPHNRGHL